MRVLIDQTAIKQSDSNALLVVRILETLFVQCKFIQSLFIFYRSVEMEKLRVYSYCSWSSHSLIAQLA